jgi:hypothetical protein
MTNSTTTRNTTDTFNTSDVLSPTAKTTDVSQQDEQTDARLTEINAQNGLWHSIRCTLTVRVRTVVETIREIEIVCACVDNISN